MTDHSSRDRAETPSDVPVGGGWIAADLVPLLRRASALIDAIPPDLTDLVAERDALTTVIEGHLLNRLHDHGGPPVVAVTGLGGTGKSGLVNRLVGRVVTPEGPVRPTTRNPVIITPGRQEGPAWSMLLRTMRAASPSLHIIDGSHAAGGGPRGEIPEEIPEETPEATRDRAGKGTRQLTGTGAAGAGAGVILVDLPAGAGSVRWTEIADICIVVTTPGRYADAGEWDLLGRVVEQGMETLVVLNRAEGMDDEVGVDLRHRLDDAGIGTLVHCVTDGFAAGIDELRDELAAAATPRRARPRLVRRMGATAERLVRLADAIDARLVAEAELLALVDRLGSTAADEMRRAVEDRHMPGAAERPWPETVERLAGVVTHRIGDAASEIAAAWTETPSGAQLIVDSGDSLWRHPPEAALTARRVLLEWPDSVDRLVAADAGRPLRPRAQHTLVDVVTRRALGGDATVPRRLRRRLRSGVDEVVVRARAGLADMAADLVAADRTRFVDRLDRRLDRHLPGSLRTVAVQLRAVAGDATVAADPVPADPPPSADARPVDAPPIDAPPAESPAGDSLAGDSPPIDALAVEAPSSDATSDDQAPVDATAVASPSGDAASDDSVPVDAPLIDPLRVDAPKDSAMPADSAADDSSTVEEVGDA